MAKKIKTVPVQPVTPATTAGPATVQAADQSWSWRSFKGQAAILAALAFVIYFNTFFNEFAHDDGIVIVKNEYVLEGFAGIPKILTSDAYDSYYRQLNTVNQLNGGRYRPLSIVTFAIEQQFFGAVPEDKVDSILKQSVAYGVRGPQEKELVRNMHVRHVVNVLIYMLSVVVLLYFLRSIVFKEHHLMAFIAALLFTVHPIHTEVVANVKSRDEIMSLLFMCLTFIYAFRFEEDKQPKNRVIALVFYFMAFLSKEYAITMIVLLPMALYLFGRKSLSDSIMAFLPYLAVIVIYIALRYHTASTEANVNSNKEVLNNPYLFATPVEKIATEIGTSLNYLKLLIFPHPLSADYSYNSIPYKDFSNPWVLLSLLVHGAMIAGLIMMLVRVARQRAVAGKTILQVSRSSVAGPAVICFALAVYLLHLALVCNVFFDIGATMGERLIYHSSVGFAIGIAYLLVTAVERMQDRATAHKALAGIMTVVVVLAGYKTIARNANWKNDNSLFKADLATVPNSVLVNANVAAANITLADYEKDSVKRREYLVQAIQLLDHALEIHPKFVAAFLNRGIAYFKLDSIEKARANMDMVKQLYPTYPTLAPMYKLIADHYSKLGWEQYGKVGKYAEAIAEFKKGLDIDPSNADLWYNTGGAYYSNHQYGEAIQAFQQTLKLRPDFMAARQGLQAAMAAQAATPK